MKKYNFEVFLMQSRGLISEGYKQSTLHILYLYVERRKTTQ